MCNHLVELCLHSNKWDKWAACVEAQRGSGTIGTTFTPKPPQPLLFLQSITSQTPDIQTLRTAWSSGCDRFLWLSVVGGFWYLIAPAPG